MILAEIDPIQIIIIVIAMGAGFIQWVWGLLKQSSAEKNRDSTPSPTPEERAAREEAWRKQVEQSQQPNRPQRPQRPNPQAPPPVHPDPWSTVRDVFEQMKEQAKKAQQPDTPPPLPQRPARAPAPSSSPVSRPARGSVRADLHPTSPTPPVLADTFPGTIQTPATLATPPVYFATPPPPRAAKLDPRPPTPDFHGLRQKLHSPASLKQAILFREILGPPKALQSSADAPF